MMFKNYLNKITVIQKTFLFVPNKHIFLIKLRKTKLTISLFFMQKMDFIDRKKIHDMRKKDRICEYLAISYNFKQKRDQTHRACRKE